MASPGSNVAYCDIDELKPFIDTRILGILVSDTGKPYVGDPWSESNVLPNQLLAACGNLEAALLVGAKYTAEELSVDNLSTASRMHMLRIIAGLLMGGLRDRRGVIAGDKAPVIADWAEKEITKLRNGIRILSIPTVQEAREGITARDESLVARTQRQGIVSRNSRYFGIR